VRVDGCRDLVDGVVVARHHQQREETVHLTLVAVPVDGDSRCGESVGVCLALVPQDVVLGSDDDRRWQPRVVVRAER
jgi:hypothetical protein